MKTLHLVLLTGLLAVATLLNGCVIREGGYYHSERVYHHVHGPGCGHELRGGVWVTVP